jgi:hypothetical protein
MDFIEIEVVNWGKHQRKDVRRPSWFALDNSILEDPKIFDLSDAEFKALIYIFCQASKQCSKNVHINYAHAHRSSGVSKSVMVSAISKLEKIGVTRTLRGRDADVTLQDKTRQNKRESHLAPEVPPSLTLIRIWNENCGRLAKVKKSTPSRNKKILTRWPENSPEEWEEIVRRIAKSDFCNGKSERGWVATFDWLLQPDTHLKVSEGKFDNRRESQHVNTIGGLANV